MDDSKLRKFIVDAKKHTYAAKAIEEKLSDGSRMLEYENGLFNYDDKYFLSQKPDGLSSFHGTESVFHKGRMIWHMLYSGGMLNDLENSEDIYAFLRKALIKVLEDMPYRGPERYVEGDLEYLCTVEGDLEKFHGTEKILRKGVPIYSLRFSGQKS